jgi:hypothetical protein
MQQIPPEQVLIGVILFYVVFSLAFFMADHHNDEFVVNIIGLYNAFITVTAMVLYLVTANVFCCVIAVASCLASYIAELVLGTIYFPSGLNQKLWPKYAHHICYIIIITCGLYFKFQILASALFTMVVELSTGIKSIKRIWKIRDKWFDALYTIIFFITRIVLWVSIIYIMYLLSETHAERVCIGLLALFTVAHIVWAWLLIRNFIRRYVSRNEVPTSTP